MVRQLKDNRLKISIITINYNNKTGLERTVNSVINQSYEHIEYIIIDGSSTDGSKAIIKKYEERIAYYLSEPDTGVYNAMNKGIRASTGKYLLFLNSGDVFIENNVIERVVETRCAKDLIICDLIYLKKGKKYLWHPEEKLTFDTLYSKSIPHPSTLISRKLFDLIGLYDESLQIVSDWKFFMLAICKYNCCYKRLSIELAEFSDGGMSTDPDNYPIIVSEKRAVAQEYFPAFLPNYFELLTAREQLRNLKFVTNLKKVFGFR